MSKRKKKTGAPARSETESPAVAATSPAAENAPQAPAVDVAAGAAISQPSQKSGPRGRGRVAIALIILASLVTSSALQFQAHEYRQMAISRNMPQALTSSPRVSNLDSFSLVLLLGGLRGPLVMYLWGSSETQKNEKDLESFDTQVELIRLLQPEFATVHLFQIWNKAYNISVQYASNANKYAAVVDAIEYAKRIDRGSPNDINIISEIGGLYGDKLGGSAEKLYYRRRVLTESMPICAVTFPANQHGLYLKALKAAGLDEAKIRTSADKKGVETAILEKTAADRLAIIGKFTGDEIAYTYKPRQQHRAETTGRRTELDTLLDANGMLLPELTTPRYTLGSASAVYDGSELQFLKPFEKFGAFKYGVSPYALAYNYHKRAYVLGAATKQRHVQKTEAILSGLPGIALKGWASETLERGRLIELDAVAVPKAMAGMPVELRAALIEPNAAILDPLLLNEAIETFSLGAKVSGWSIDEFEQHQRIFGGQRLQNYDSVIDELRAQEHLSLAGGAYLEAVRAAGSDKALFLRKLKEAVAQYDESKRRFMIIMLKYYVSPDDIADYQRQTLDQYTVVGAQSLLESVFKRLGEKYQSYDRTMHGGHLSDYMKIVVSINHRRQLADDAIKQLTQPATGAAPAK